MKLTDWLNTNSISRVEFARRTRLSPSAVTQLCNNEAAWLSRETAEVIFRETKGAVTPNDFLSPFEDAPAEALRAAPVGEAIEAFARGEFVIVTDDDDRENEGDIFVAASKCTPDKMAFMIRHTSGIVCAALPAEVARRLRLDPMVAANDAPLGTAFTVSVDVRHGLTTGISADERTATVRALANGNSGAGDFVRPGHVFPLIAKDGGVLMRTGHTEACVDLCRLAKLPLVGALAELTNDDGSVMRGPAVAAFAHRHNIKRISVADLIAYRQARESLVKRIATFPVETAVGGLTGHTYMTPFDDVHHFAFVFGEIGDGHAVPARLHRAQVVGDVFGGAKLVNLALDRFKAEGRGVLVYLRDGAAGVPVLPVADSEDVKSEVKRQKQWREIGLGAQILRDLGVVSIKNLVTRPQAYVALSGFGIEIAETTLLEGADA
ncbi:MAG: 3,4-dihydroxy-2-butanone-4-phosphate synthase [Alphaproteobacteria bacterium]|nr:3,4-dihydroxy-2-butanone-4-phosphate synthase [Alphaproteobacteria bacterium]